MRRVPQDRFTTNAVFFVTMTVEGRREVFRSIEAAQVVTDSLTFFCRRRETEMIGYAVMPDHVHVLLRLRPPLTLPNWVRRFKTFTTRSLGGCHVWQSGYWSEVVATEWFVREKLTYIHNNPVRAGLVDDPAAYPLSSAREYESGAWNMVTPYWDVDMECSGAEPAA